MQGGLEHLSWGGGTLRHVRQLLVIAEPQSKSMMTAARAVPLARDLGITEIGLVGNRVRDQGDRDALAALAQKLDIPLLAEIPDDDAVIDADQRGIGLLDRDPDAPAVAAITELAARLVPVTSLS